MILIMKILLHNVYKIINWWYPTYVYQFFNFPYNYKNRVLACFQTRPQLMAGQVFPERTAGTSANSGQNYCKFGSKPLQLQQLPIIMPVIKSFKSPPVHFKHWASSKNLPNFIAKKWRYYLNARVGLNF